MTAKEPNTIPQPTDKTMFHMYVARGCPFCHRVLATLALTGLKDQVTYTWMRNVKSEAGWEIEPGKDPLFGANFLREVYEQLEPGAGRRKSVPLLVDLSSKTLLSISSAEMTRYFARGMNGAHSVPRELSPVDLVEQIDAMNAWLHSHVNRAVYTVAFATEQADYEEKVGNLFRSLDELESRLTTQSYLLGNTLTESDLYLLATLERFDSVYYPLFKCGYRRIADYPVLSNYHERLAAIDGVAETYSHACTKEHYYRSVMHVDGQVRDLNPSRLVPVDPFTHETTGAAACSGPSSLTEFIHKKQEKTLCESPF